MVFFLRARGNPRRLAVLPGTFNPVTVAHLALAKAALRRVDEVLFVLPRLFPHKEYSGASFDQRINILAAAVSGPEFSIASSRGGLFAEIAGECREAYPDGTQLSFLCGRDAAERVVDWDYGRPGALAGMLRDFVLLVAARDGEYHAPPDLAHAIAVLRLDQEYPEVSATEVRRRIRSGEAWEHLVPPAAAELVREVYRGS